MTESISHIFDEISVFALKDPYQTELGRSIVYDGIHMMSNIGFEEFTFKKLGAEIGSPEASIYRYFENKHRLLLYINALHWGMIDVTCQDIMSSDEAPISKAHSIIDILCTPPKVYIAEKSINGEHMYHIVMSESVKTFMTKHVDNDNHRGAFKRIKSVTSHLAFVIANLNPSCRYPRALASTIIEMSMFQRFFSEHLPSMTDIGTCKSIGEDLKDLMMGMIYAGGNRVI
ncbi:MAG: TetR family transcriptional regulator [Bacteroidetes bacterium]|nr:TetR family transcriptional regulator [bacterium]NBP63361.1 TetR family transcriptional regulator [Bacteroidota bacterium]